MKNKLLSLLLGLSLCAVVGLTVDQIMQNVYDSSNTALRVNLVAGGGGSGLTVGTSTITNGTNGQCLYDDNGVLGEQACGSAVITDLSYSGKLNATSITGISASATPAAADRYIRCTSGAGAVTYTLPEATGSGRVLEVKKIDSGAGTCVVSQATDDTIDGATTYTLSAQYQAVTVFDAATNVWDVL